MAEMKDKNRYNQNSVVQPLLTGKYVVRGGKIKLTVMMIVAAFGSTAICWNRLPQSADNTFDDKMILFDAKNQHQQQQLISRVFDFDLIVPEG